MNQTKIESLKEDLHLARLECNLSACNTALNGLHAEGVFDPKLDSYPKIIESFRVLPCEGLYMDELCDFAVDEPRIAEKKIEELLEQAPLHLCTF